MLLARSFAALDDRREALRMLTEGTDRWRVAPALALLAEFGRGEDRPGIAGFAEDPRPAVAREARRALARAP